MNREEQLNKELEPYHNLINKELELVKANVSLKFKEYYRGYFDGERKVNEFKSNKNALNQFAYNIDNTNISSKDLYRLGFKRGFKFFKFLWEKLLTEQIENDIPF